MHSLPRLVRELHRVRRRRSHLLTTRPTVSLKSRRFHNHGGFKKKNIFLFINHHDGYVFDDLGECCCDVILRGDAPFERVAAVSAISTRRHALMICNKRMP
jgi:hypothetical protein